MILHQAMTKTKDGLFEIDMNVIRQMAHAFDEGLHSEECIIARFIVAAYDQGFEQGIHESEERHKQTAFLMMCTGGNA